MYESVINALVSASDPAHVRQIVEDRAWINYIDEYDRPHGKIVPIHPLLFLPEGNIADVELIGAIPYVARPGINVHGSINQYAAAIRFGIAAESKMAAERYLASLLWYIPNRGVDYQGYSSPISLNYADNDITA